MLKVFLSYARENGDLAKLATDQLKLAQLDVLIDRDFIPPGAYWREEIDQQISRCNVLLVLLTAASASSLYVTYEWAYGLGCGKPVIPITFETCELPPRLDALHVTEFIHAEFQDWNKISGEIRKLALISGFRRKGWKYAEYQLIRRSIDPSYTDEMLNGFAQNEPHRFKKTTSQYGNVALKIA